MLKLFINNNRCGSNQLEPILSLLESIESDIGGLEEKMSDLTQAQLVEWEKCSQDDTLTTNKVNTMFEKVQEVRQFVGYDALSKGMY